MPSNKDGWLIGDGDGASDVTVPANGMTGLSERGEGVAECTAAPGTRGKALDRLDDLSLPGMVVSSAKAGNRLAGEVLGGGKAAVLVSFILPIAKDISAKDGYTQACS
jgi:hypothetical protein